jgi:hypothetical protein
MGFSSVNYGDSGDFLVMFTVPSDISDLTTRTYTVSFGAS